MRVWLSVVALIVVPVIMVPAIVAEGNHVVDELDGRVEWCIVKLARKPFPCQLTQLGVLDHGSCFSSQGLRSSPARSISAGFDLRSFST